MTIADKLIPAFYVVDLTGSAATLQHLLGTVHNIKTITISSRDMKNDLAAYDAMDKTINTFKGIVVEDEMKVNPEFYPSTPPIDITPEMEELEARMNEAATAMEDTEPNAIATAITRRFDEWGDFVSIKRELRGEGFLIKAKVAVHPRRYVIEKTKDIQEQHERLHGQKLKTGTALH